MVGAGGKGGATLACSLEKTSGLEEKCPRAKHALLVERMPAYLELVTGSAGPRQDLHFREK